jgi:hypothetical protein
MARIINYTEFLQDDYKELDTEEQNDDYKEQDYKEQDTEEKDEYKDINDKDINDYKEHEHEEDYSDMPELINDNYYFETYIIYDTDIPELIEYSDLDM